MPSLQSTRQTGVSREAIARLLGRLDYGDSEDDVDHDLRLNEVDGLLGSGLVVDVDDLLYEDQLPMWHRLAEVMPKLGWKPLLFESVAITVAWVLPHVTKRQVDDAQTPQIIVGTGINHPGQVVWWPAIHGDDEPTDPVAFPTIEALFTWLSQP
jgi:hypothetical protein